MRTARNASFFEARGEKQPQGKGAEEPPGGPTADRKHGRGVARGGRERPLQKCVVTHFAARGPGGPLEPWRRAAVGGIGVLWNPGDAF